MLCAEDVCVCARHSAIHSAISQCFTYKDEFNEKQRERKNRDIKITHSNETTTKHKKETMLKFAYSMSPQNMLETHESQQI